MRMGLAGAALAAPVLVAGVMMPALMSGELTDPGPLALRFGIGVCVAMVPVGLASRWLLSKHEASARLVPIVQDGDELSVRIVSVGTGAGPVRVELESDDGQRWHATAPSAPQDTVATGTLWHKGGQGALGTGTAVWPAQPV